jgi:hypothetical protein
MHHEKQRNLFVAAGASVGTKQQSNGMQIPKSQGGITYAAAVVGKKTMAGVTQITGDGVQKTTPPEGIMSATTVVGEKDLAGETQVTGDGASKLVLEGEKFPEICSQDHDHQDSQIQGEITQGLKENLLSLQREIASCLYMLEMGWGNRGKGVQLNQGKGENGLKIGPHKEDGPGIRPSPTYNYAKTYARRRPRRQLRWRPKLMGRVQGQATGASSENGRSWSPKRGDESDHADKRTAQPRAEDITPSDGAMGGGEVTKTHGHAGINAELAGICEAVSDTANKPTYQPSIGDIPAADTLIGEEDENNAGSDAEMAENNEEIPGVDIGGTEIMGEVTDNTEETMGYSLTHKVGLDQLVKETRLESKVADTGEKGGRETDNAEEGEIKQTGGVDGVGQAVDQITLPLCYAGDVAGGIPGSESLGGGIEHYGEVVVFVKNPVQQYDMETERETDKNIGEIVRADTEVEQGESEMLEIQPLAVMGADECQTDAWDGVLEKILAFCQELGSECDGHEEKLMALFTAIEANRNNRKGGNATKKGDKGGNRSNRELKRLKSTVNYDVKGSAIVSGKGRNGKFC